MRLAPIPLDVEIAVFERRGRLGPPPDMTDQDCETVDVIHSIVTLPSGHDMRTVRALVHIDEDELARIREAGGHFWVEFVGNTFPPVMFFVPGGGDDVDGDPSAETEGRT